MSYSSLTELHPPALKAEGRRMELLVLSGAEVSPPTIEKDTIVN